MIQLRATLNQHIMNPRVPSPILKENQILPDIIMSDGIKTYSESWKMCGDLTNGVTLLFWQWWTSDAGSSINTVHWATSPTITNSNE